MLCVVLYVWNIVKILNGVRPVITPIRVVLHGVQLVTSYKFNSVSITKTIVINCMPKFCNSI